jgi:hypothetical protein
MLVAWMASGMSTGGGISSPMQTAVLSWGDTVDVLQILDELSPRWPPSVVEVIRQLGNQTTTLAGGQVIQ